MFAKRSANRIALLSLSVLLLAAATVIPVAADAFAHGIVINVDGVDY